VARRDWPDELIAQGVPNQRIPALEPRPPRSDIPASCPWNENITWNTFLVTYQKGFTALVDPAVRQHWTAVRIDKFVANFAIKSDQKSVKHSDVNAASSSLSERSPLSSGPWKYSQACDLVNFKTMVENCMQ